MTDRINTNIRFFLPNDPYFYGVDNLPIKDLLSNDEILQFQVDQLKAQLAEISGRSSFGELKPYTDEDTPGKVLVNPGNFIARMNTASDREVGLSERPDDGVHLDSDKYTVSNENPDYGINAPSAVGGIARTALVRFFGDNVTVPQFTTESYPEANSTDNKAPAYRLDLVYVEAYPAEDQDRGKPKVGIIRGGYFLHSETAPSIRKEGHRFADPASGGGSELEGRTLMQQTYDVTGTVINEKKGAITSQNDLLRYSTVPLVEDLKNYIFKSASGVNVPTFAGSFDDVPTEAQLSRWVSDQAINRGVFCLPIAYVLTPFGHLEGDHIPNSNIIDIRPFFRTAEMTLDERQAVAASYQPSLTNRFLTRRDPDYVKLRDTWVKGLGQNAPGNLEGRMLVQESQITGGLRNDIVQASKITNNGGRGSSFRTNGTNSNVKVGNYLAFVNFHIAGTGGPVNNHYLRFEAYGQTTGTVFGAIDLFTFSDSNIDNNDEGFGAAIFTVSIPEGSDGEKIIIKGEILEHGTGNSTTSMSVGINDSMIVLTNEGS